MASGQSGTTRGWLDEAADELASVVYHLNTVVALSEFYDRRGWESEARSIQRRAAKLCEQIERERRSS